MEKIKYIYRKLCPCRLRVSIYTFRVRLHLIKSPEKYEKERFQKIQTGTYMESQREECEYMLKEGRTSVFPYTWTKEYRAERITVYIDKAKHMPYVNLADGGRRMYFPRGYSKTQVREYFSRILIEQDRRSPHYYFNPSDEKLSNSTFLDIGGAEGYITLTVLPYVREAIIFECDKMWIGALAATFEPYRDKVRIVSKYVGGKDSGDTVCVDSVVNGKDNIVLKMDVEGMEKEVFSGAEETLNKPDTKVFVCTYHKKHDEEELGEILRNHGFKTSTSDGWLYFGNEDASFRRGIIRAWKE